MEKHPAPRLGTSGDVIAKRLIAFVIDSIILGVIYSVLFAVGTLLGDIGFLLFGLISFVISIVYVFLLEGLYGYTPGKAAMGLVVVKSDGSNCTIGASILRNLLLLIDQLPFAYVLGIILIVVTENNQRVGDFVGDTIVVEQQ